MSDMTRTLTVDVTGRESQPSSCVQPPALKLVGLFTRRLRSSPALLPAFISCSRLRWCSNGNASPILRFRTVPWSAWPWRLPHLPLWTRSAASSISAFASPPSPPNPPSPATLSGQRGPIVFWLVWNAEKSILEVENFTDAINLSAQTALRNPSGATNCAQMITERESMGQQLQLILDAKTNPWASRCNRSRFATCASPRHWKTPCRSRPKPNVSAGSPDPGGRRKPRSRSNSPKPPGLRRQPRRPPLTGDEHALRSHEGEGRYGLAPQPLSKPWASAARSLQQPSGASARP